MVDDRLTEVNSGKLESVVFTFRTFPEIKAYIITLAADYGLSASAYMAHISKQIYDKKGGDIFKSGDEIATLKKQVEKLKTDLKKKPKEVVKTVTKEVKNLATEKALSIENSKLKKSISALENKIVKIEKELALKSNETSELKAKAKDMSVMLGTSEKMKKNALERLKKANDYLKEKSNGFLAEKLKQF